MHSYELEYKKNMQNLNFLILYQLILLFFVFQTFKLIKITAKVLLNNNSILIESKRLSIKMLLTFKIINLNNK